MANIVWDDGRVSNLGGGQWSSVLMDRFFGGGAIWPAFAESDSGQFGALGISFHGTKIAFHGNTPLAAKSQNFQVSIDGGSPSQVSYSDSSPPSALQWYQSPSLSDGEHTIALSHLAGTSFDYFVITAGPNTPLSGERLIVDDGDNDITYSGNWARKEGRYTSRDDPHSGLPHGGAVRQSGTKGSKATFVFSGNDVAVYSVFDFSHIGWVTVKYTVDGSFQTVTHAVTESTTQYKNGVLQQENTLLWKSDGNLPLGDHQLTVEIVDSDGQTNYVLDYILYTPSFRTLASKPNLSPTTAQTTAVPTTTSASSSNGANAASSISGQGPSSSKSSGTGTATGSVTGSIGWITVSSGTVQTLAPSVSSTGGTSSNNGVNSAQDTSATKSTPVGAIAGGVVGGVAVLALLLILFLCRKRLSRRASTKEEVPTETPGNNNLLSVNPFTETTPNMTESKAHLASSSIPVTAGMSSASTDGWSSHLSDHGSSDRSTSDHKSQPSQTTSPGVLSPLRREYVQARDAGSNITSVTGPVLSAASGGTFRNKMHRLQELVTELNREISLNGEDSVRVAELKGRIAELTRETEVEDVVREQGMRQSLATTVTVPPPYEPR